MRILKTTFLATVVLAIAVTASSQTPRFEAIHTDSTAYPQILAELDLRTSTGELAYGLSSSSITIYEEGQLLNGDLTIGPDPDGTALVVALDVSKSMKPQFEKVKEFLITVFAGLGDRDQGAIVAFSDKPVVMSQFTADKSLLVNIVNSLSADSDATEFFYATYESLQLLQGPNLPKRRVLLIISDGKNEGVNYTSEDCVDLAIRERIRILTLGVPSNSAPALLNMRRLAERSGGFYWPVDVDYPGYWMGQVEMVVRHIRTRQTLRWTTSFRPDGDTHLVEIQAIVTEREVRHQVKSTSSVKVPAAPPVPSPEPFWKNPYVASGIAAGFLLLIAAIVILIVNFRKGEIQIETQERQMEKQEEGIQNILDQFEKVRREQHAAGSIPQPSSGGPEQTVPTGSGGRKQTVFMPQGRKAAENFQSAWIEIADGPGKGQRHQIDQDTISIGRDPGNEIMLDEHRVSSRHALITRQGGKFLIEDLGSTNGTFLESGERLNHGAEGHHLANGELVRVGGVIILFRGQT